MNPKSLAIVLGTVGVATIVVLWLAAIYAILSIYFVG
jgi:hypothetical protein